MQLLAGLEEQGLKLTKQRRQLVELLASDESHPDAQDLFRKARKKIPTLSLSTVYYTLNELKQRGLIRELEFYDRNNRYDINIAEHVNLICRKCNTIQDYHDSLLTPKETVQKKTGFSVEDMRLEYYGLCKECLRKK
jgi:Fur family peroxide stress response transcriptional regulator